MSDGPRPVAVDPGGSTAGAAASAPRDEPDREIADTTGEAALPRRNGELVFESAWAGRTFGMTIALTKAEAFPWNEFRDRLIAEIADAERRGAASSYYERWFAAFERVLEARGLVSRAELEARVAEFDSGRRDDVY